MPTCAASSTCRPTCDAVRDLDEVVDLRAGADARLADGGTIDRRVRADLDVVFDDDVAVLRDLLVRAVLAAARSRSRRRRSRRRPATMTRWPITTARESTRVRG